MEINKIQPSKNKFTETLVNIPDAPKTLYFKGQLPKKRIKTVAIVGTRKPTVYGKEVTTRLAGELARNGIIVVSGMALGIDGVAHRARFRRRRRHGKPRRLPEALRPPL